MIRVLLVDDHYMFLEGLQGLLAKQQDLEVVGMATDGLAALRLASELSPDVVVMDVAMPELNGIDAAAELLKSSPKARVIGLSTHVEPRFVADMLEAGAAGYLPKACASSELIRAVRAVAAGQVYLSPTVATAVVDGYLDNKRGERAAARPLLSSREREVLQFLAEGKGAGEIAILLQVGPGTVATYRRRIMSKLGLHSIADLVKYAIRTGLTTPVS